MGGPCLRCSPLEGACRFFVLRFWRETVRLRRRQIDDPIGAYWREIAPVGSSAWVFARLHEADRKEVASVCFQDGMFDRAGKLFCRHRVKGVDGPGSGDYGWCVEELWCEMFAAWLTVPMVADLVGDDDELAARWMVEPWVIRFRRVLEEVTSP